MLPHWELRFGLYAISWAVVNFLAAATLSHVSQGATTYVLHFWGMQISVPAAGKSVQNAGSLLAFTK